MIIENGKIDPKVHNLLRGMLNPEKYGNAVTPEVRRGSCRIRYEPGRTNPICN